MKKDVDHGIAPKYQPKVIDQPNRSRRLYEKLNFRMTGGVSANHIGTGQLHSSRLPPNLELKSRQATTQSIKMGNQQVKDFSEKIYVTDRIRQKKFIIDTTVKYSMIPRHFIDASEPSEAKKSTVEFNGQKTYVFGRVSVEVDFGSEETGPIKWPFYIANIEEPVLGTDFLRDHEFLIDIANSRILFRTQLLRETNSRLKKYHE